MELEIKNSDEILILEMALGMIRDKMYQLVEYHEGEISKRHPKGSHTLEPSEDIKLRRRFYDRSFVYLKVSQDLNERLEDVRRDKEKED